jgi:bis(5'-adenosyl)-triphosphatase
MGKGVFRCTAAAAAAALLFRSQATPLPAAFLVGGPHHTLRTKATTSSSIFVKMASTSTSTAPAPEPIQFGRFKIAAEHVVYQSPTGLSRVIVNLRPLVPNHLLVLSTRVVPHLEDLRQDEYMDLWNTVRVMQQALQLQLQESSSTSLSFNVAVQDGTAAGQSVPHVHVHILPRSTNITEYDIYNAENRNDDIYTDLEEWSADSPNENDDDKVKVQNTKLEVKPDSERRDRTSDEMAAETSALRQALLATEH